MIRATANSPLALSGLLLLLLLLAPNAPAQAAKSQDERSGVRAITGRVLGDGEQPVPNALVAASSPNATALRRRTTLTDESGSFRLDDLSSGAYLVSASKPAMISADAAEAPRYYRPGDSVTIRLRRGGVVTGRVTDSSGHPIVAIPVRAIRVRDENGKQIRASGYPRALTDDRGVYRLYSLYAGSYLVCVGAGTPGYPAFEEDVPTYYPSATRDTATEVVVRAGEETAGIDIRHRGVPGHTVSGILLGLEGAQQATIELRDAMTGRIEQVIYTMPNQPQQSFGFFGVADGDYFVVANAHGTAPNRGASEPRRIKVKQADLTGLQLPVIPGASVAGRVVLEAPPDSLVGCKDLPLARAEEALIGLRRDGSQEDEFLRMWGQPAIVVPSDQGDFSFLGLRPARFRVETHLLNESQFVRSITLGSGSAGTGDVARDGVILRSGDRVGGVTITLAQGAASVRGRVDGYTARGAIAVHLIPAEKDSENEVVRYYESTIGDDGDFGFANVAPGRYFVAAMASGESPYADLRPHPAAWDPAVRNKLQYFAAQSGVEIELKPCQRMTDYAFRYSAILRMDSGPPRH
jgi:hypothetical protein